MGVYGGDGVNRGVSRYRWECFGSFIEEGAFGGYYFIHIYLLRWFMGVLEDHDREATLFWFIFGLQENSGV